MNKDLVEPSTTHTHTHATHQQMNHFIWLVVRLSVNSALYYPDVTHDENPPLIAEYDSSVIAAVWNYHPANNSQEEGPLVC